MQPKDKKAEDLQRLIQSLYKSAPEAAVVEDLLKHSFRILNSFLGNNANEDVQATKQKVMEKISRFFNNDSKTLVKTQELMQKISRSRTLSRKPEALKLLVKLSDMNPGVAESFDSLFRSKVLPSTARENTRLNTTQTNFNSTVFSTSRRPLPDQLLSIRNRGSPQQNISELQILREIAFIMQNISGNLIVTDKDFYMLKPSINVSEPVRRIVRELCEIGWLFKKITGKIEDQGTVRDAFNIAVREELNQYYRWIALIQNMAKSDELNLRKLVLWSFQPFQRLKWIAIVSQAVNPYKGCKIISILNSYRPQGNPAINQMLNRLLSHIIQPLMKFIYLWIYKGQLNDTINEYFIFDDPTVMMPRLWQDKYTILWDNIPNLIDHESALMIFNTGKTINFLKKCCNHDYQIDVEFIDMKLLFKQGDLSSTFPDEFKHWLRLISDRAHKELMDVLFNKFKLKMHLDAVKRFLLMGQGEFIHNLMDSLSRELDKPAHQIYKHNLMGIIEGALRSSNTQFLNPEILLRVSCRLLEQGTEGWDIFSLDYLIDSPLNTLLSPDAMRSYLRIFNFLWKVKRVDHSLSQVWLSHAKQTLKARQDRGIFHSCHLLRYSMMHFVTNIYSYIMVAIESAWQGFMHNLDKAANFDEILVMHERLLTELLDITFLSPRTKNINTTLFNVFQLIYRFKISQNKLLEDYREYTERLRDYNMRKKAASKNITSGDDLHLPVFETDAGRKIKDMKELYDKAFKQFSNLIKKEEEKLTFLNFRLDFSEYYEFLFVRKNYVE